MTELWCWRCQQEIPMLDEDEWPEMAAALRHGICNIKARRQATGASLAEVTEGEKLQAQYSEALDLYECLTGHRETNPLALHHHRVSIYGPPCETCGKPLRTPKAKLCAECGIRRAV